MYVNENCLHQTARHINVVNRAFDGYWLFPWELDAFYHFSYSFVTTRVNVHVLLFQKKFKTGYGILHWSLFKIDPPSLLNYFRCYGLWCIEWMWKNSRLAWNWSHYQQIDMSNRTITWTLPWHFHMKYLRQDLGTGSGIQ